MAKETEKHAGGRPTKYKPEYENQALILAEKGFTDKEIASIFNVTEQTLNNWKKDFPQFFESLKKGKEIADQKVVQSLYQRALGYSHPEVHISNFQGEITKTNIIKHYPPDTTACIFWLKNRDKENWRDKQDIGITGEAFKIIIERPDKVD
jgi:transcriptional regulator with XRE-family HTH domain